MAATTPDEEIVRASGFCIVCDFRFTDEVVLRFREPALPGGWAYVETRHLDACELQRLRRSPPTSYGRLVVEPGGKTKPVAP